MNDEVRAAVDRWHEAVNDGDPGLAAATVTDPVLVRGPHGSGHITSVQFGEWVVRSGIRLVPVARHPAGGAVVVEQDATWPGADVPVRVATVFRVAGDRVTAALRFDDLAAALAAAESGVPPDADGRIRPLDAGRGIRPLDAGRGIQPPGAGRVIQPPGAGRGIQPPGAGRGIQPPGAGRGGAV